MVRSNHQFSEIQHHDGRKPEQRRSGTGRMNSRGGDDEKLLVSVLVGVILGLVVLVVMSAAGAL